MIDRFIVLFYDNRVTLYPLLIECTLIKSLYLCTCIYIGGPLYVTVEKEVCALNHC